MEVQDNLCVCVHYFQRFFHYVYGSVYWSFYWRLVNSADLLKTISVAHRGGNN
jgi:hypothetical protein